MLPEMVPDKAMKREWTTSHILTAEGCRKRDNSPGEAAMKRSNVLAIPILLGALAILGFSAESQTLSFHGVVVAILGANEGVRVIDPNSIGDLAEVYMVRVDSTSLLHEQKYMLVEYIHHKRPIPYSQFDAFSWSFDARHTASGQGNACLDWLRPGLSFVPTRLGRHTTLPDPRTLSCYVTTKRPVPFPRVRQSRTPSE